jgi:sugar O-acyltransferase (sialic acid O-acetyltransferase NeuD family)
MKELAIYGAGGLGREFSLLVDQINRHKYRWNVIGFFDDGKEPGTRINGLDVLGNITQLNQHNQDLDLIIAIADPLKRKIVFSQVSNPHVSYPVVIHPSADIGSQSNILGQGTVVTGGCFLTTNISLGEFNIINLSTTIGHDVKTGPFVSIMPGCNISGNVTIGSQSLIGTGAKILQNLQIGSRCKVGAGAVVVRSFADDLTLVGVPACVKKGKRS